MFPLLLPVLLFTLFPLPTPTSAVSHCLVGMFASTGSDPTRYRGNTGEGVTAFRLASQVVNERKLLGKEDRFEIVDMDTTTRNDSVVQMMSVVGDLTCAGGQKPIGVVGPPFSTFARMVSGIANTQRIPLVSPSASASFLSVRDLYPNFLRTHPADEETGSALAELVIGLGWNSACAVGSFDEYGNAMARNFKEQAGRIGLVVPLTVLISEVTIRRDAPLSERKLAMEKMRTEMEPLREEECRVIVATLFGYVDLFVEALDGLDMIGDDYAILVNDPLIQDVDDMAANRTLVDDETRLLAPLMKGMVGVVPNAGGKDRPLRRDLDELWKNRTDSSTDSITNPMYDNGDGVPSTAATVYAYDAVMVFADAVRRVRTAGGDARDGGSLIPALFATDMEGASGRIVFDNVTNNRIGMPYDVYNVAWDNATRVAVGSIIVGSRGSGNENGTVDVDNVVWYGPNQPVGYAIFDKSITTNYVAVACAVSGLGIAVSLLFGAMLVPKRNVPVVRMSSPLFLALITLGCVFSFASTIVLAMRVTDASCHAWRWLIFPGFTLVFGSLFVKIQRAHVIFNNPMAGAAGRGISSASLLTKLGAMLLLDAVILAVWTAAFRLEVIPVEIDGNKGKIRIFECSGSADNIFFSIFAVYKLSLLSWGVWLAVRTRKVTLKDMNESKLVGVTLYTIALLALVAIPIVLLLNSTRVARVTNLETVFALTMVVVSVAYFTALFLMVGSKVWLIYVKKIQTQGQRSSKGMENVVVQRGGTQLQEQKEPIVAQGKKDAGKAGSVKDMEMAERSQSAADLPPPPLPDAEPENAEGMTML